MSLGCLSNHWNWNNSHQIENHFITLNNRLFSSCLKNKNIYRRLIGLPLGIGHGSVMILSQIAIIAEHLIKGVGNLIISFYTEQKLQFLIGSNQIKLAAKNAFQFVITLPYVVIISLLAIPIITAISPETSIKLFVNHGSPLNLKISNSDTSDFQNDWTVEFTT